MLRRSIILVLVMLFALGEVGPSIVLAQDQAQQQPVKKRKTLLEMLFGSGDEQQKPPVVDAPVIVKKPKAAALPPPKPTILKADTATKLAVFGDSLAVDLAKALERFYADDPNIIIVNQGVGSSGLVRDDFFDWQKAATEQVADNAFDIAVMIIGINDRQTLTIGDETYKSLTPEWITAYQARVAQLVSTIRGGGKPVIWIGLPAMSKSDFSTSIGQISAIQRLGAFSSGGEFLDIYERFVDDNGKYSSFGPDLNGQRVRMRKDDGIHFSAAGADKLAFYLSQSIKLFYRGGGSVGIDVADALAGTDAALMVRPPYQGFGQIRLLEVAGAVIPLNLAPRRAIDLVTASAAPDPDAYSIDLTSLVTAPVGRVDDFGVGGEAAMGGPE